MITVDQVLATRAIDPDGLSRAMKWSFGIHFGLVLLAIVVPREWIASDRTEPEVMTISLGAGTPGERSGGQTSIGAKTVEQVAPPPPRPLPVTPATAPPPRADTSVALPTPPRPPPPATTKPPAPVRQPPATGEQVRQGTSSAETGAQQDAAGLSFGGGDAGQAMVSANFCCPWYFEEMLARIRGVWRADLPGVRTDTVLQFTITRDGTITDVQVVTSGSTMGEFEARRALNNTKLNPIPRQAEEQEIVIRLRFPYGRER